MRVWIIGVVVLVLTAALVQAVPVPEEEEGGASKTLTAIRKFFSPVTRYFQSLPEKTPSDVADDVRDRVSDVRDWAEDNAAIQALRGALTPVKNWIQEKATVVKDQSFSDMYESVKTSVKGLDERLGTWLDEHTSK